MRRIKIIIGHFSGGHDNSSTTSLNSGYELNLKNGGRWTELASMTEPRRDHACLYIELEETNGILVTGGMNTYSINYSY